jgi:hypothetical protein
MRHERNKDATNNTGAAVGGDDEDDDDDVVGADHIPDSSHEEHDRHQDTTAQMASMTLVSKYNTLNEHIHEARSDIAQKIRDIDQSKRNIEQIGIERQRIKDDTVEAEQEHHDMVQELESALVEAVRSEDAHAMATNRRNEAKRQLESVRQMALDAQQKFLHDCVSYRSNIQHLALHGEVLGLGPTAPTLLAYSLVAATNTTSHPTLSEDDDEHKRSCRLDLFEAHVKSLLRAGSDERNDKESQTTSKELKEQKDRNRKTAARIQSLLDKKSSIVKSREERAAKKYNLKAQLVRLQQDVQNLHNEIGSIERERNEDQRPGAGTTMTAASTTTATSTTDTVTNQRQRNVIIHNPYASIPKTASTKSNRNLVAADIDPADITPPRWNPASVGGNGGHEHSHEDQSRHTTTSSSSSTKRRRRSVSNSKSSSSERAGRGVVVGGGNSMTGSAFDTGTMMPTSASTEQFPHRTGRVRNSRRFGTSSLRISSSVGLGDYTRCHNNSGRHNIRSHQHCLDDTSSEDSGVDDGHKVEDNSLDTLADSCIGRRASQSDQKYPTLPSIGLDDTDDEEDDDSDDDVSLSYEPVFKNPKM